MPLGGILTAAASGATSFGLSKLFGGGSKINTNPRLARISGPTFRTDGIDGVKGSTRAIVDPAFASLLERFGGVSRAAANGIRSLIPSVSPGFGLLTKSRVDALALGRERALAETVGTLRQNLAKRRLAGSSFADDAISRAESEINREFAVAEGEARARSVLEEIDATNRLLAEATRTELLGIEREIAALETIQGQTAGLVSQAQGALSNASTLAAELKAQSLAGQGAFFQPLIDKASSAVGDFVSGLLNG